MDSMWNADTFATWRQALQLCEKRTSFWIRNLLPLCITKCTCMCLSEMSLFYDAAVSYALEGVHIAIIGLEVHSETTWKSFLWRGRNWKRNWPHWQYLYKNMDDIQTLLQPQVRWTRTAWWCDWCTLWTGIGSDAWLELQIGSHIIYRCYPVHTPH